MQKTWKIFPNEENFRRSPILQNISPKNGFLVDPLWESLMKKILRDKSARAYRKPSPEMDVTFKKSFKSYLSLSVLWKESFSQTQFSCFMSFRCPLYLIKYFYFFLNVTDRHAAQCATFCLYMIIPRTTLMLRKTQKYKTRLFSQNIVFNIKFSYYS